MPAGMRPVKRTIAWATTKTKNAPIATTMKMTAWTIRTSALMPNSR